MDNKHENPKSPFLLIITLAALARLAGLGSARLWYDEAFSALAASRSLGDMILALSGDTHPPLYYLLIWPLVQLFGPSEFVLRLPSVAFSLLALWLTWKLAQDLRWPSSATMAALGFMALCPFQVHFAQEARMYAMLQALVLGALLALLQRRWVLLAVLLAAVLWTHNYGLFYAATLFLIAAWGEWRERNWRALLAFAAAGLSFVPWLWVLWGQMQTVADGYWIQSVTPGGVIYSLYMLFWGFAIYEPYQPAAVIVVAGALLITLIRVWQHRPPGALPLALLAVMPLGLAVAGSLAWRPVLLFRGLIGSSVPLYLLIAWALTRGPRWQWLYAGVFIAPILAAGLAGYYMFNPINKGGVDDMLEPIRAGWQPGDIVYHLSDETAVTVGLYAADLPHYKAPSCGLTLGQLSPVTRRGLGIIEKPLDEINYNRAWVILSLGPTSPACANRIVEQVNEPIKLLQDDQYIYAGVWLWQR